jgi:hypothetical protein
LSKNTIDSAIQCETWAEKMPNKTSIDPYVMCCFERKAFRDGEKNEKASRVREFNYNMDFFCSAGATQISHNLTISGINKEEKQSTHTLELTLNYNRIIVSSLCVISMYIMQSKTEKKLEKKAL